MFKTIQIGLPKYNSDRMEESRPLNLADTRTSMRYRVDYKLSVSRGSYFYRGSRLISLLLPDIFQARDLTTFKMQAKKWVRLNIPIHPPWCHPNQEHLVQNKVNYPLEECFITKLDKINLILSMCIHIGTNCACTMDFSWTQFVHWQLDTKDHKFDCESLNSMHFPGTFRDKQFSLWLRSMFIHRFTCVFTRFTGTQISGRKEGGFPMKNLK